ncbi:hypothetical protein [Campylobacter majalis]|uniref:hypothetical protein n=1 Tax=Campylobacter majalis TaxID=2790656 RepID=UPI003D69420C
MRTDFLMDLNTQERFFEFLQINEFSYLIMRDKKVYKTNDLYEFISEDGRLNCYLYNDFFGDINMHVDGDFMAFSDIDAPVIYLSNSLYFENTHSVKCGKVQTNITYHKDGKSVNKNKVLKEYFCKINFWLEQNLAKKFINHKQILVSNEINYLLTIGKITNFLN